MAIPVQPFLLIPPPLRVAVIMPSLYRVEFKIPKVTGLMQRLIIHVYGYDRYDAFCRALLLVPPYAQITKVKKVYP
ncbi:MAG: hypothetical protein ACUVTM_00700 [Candidatus Bathyarchaeia archaeon]